MFIVTFFYPRARYATERKEEKAGNEPVIESGRGYAGKHKQWVIWMVKNWSQGVVLV